MEETETATLARSNLPDLALVKITEAKGLALINDEINCQVRIVTRNRADKTDFVSGSRDPEFGNHYLFELSTHTRFRGRGGQQNTSQLNETIDFELYHRPSSNPVFGSTEIGRARLDLDEHLRNHRDGSKGTMSLPLLKKVNDCDTILPGTLVVTLQLLEQRDHQDLQADEYLQGHSDSEDEGGGEPFDFLDFTHDSHAKLMEAKRTTERKEVEELEKRRRQFEVQTGDWEVIIHLIEAKDLQCGGVDSDGIPKAMVSVEAFDEMPLYTHHPEETNSPLLNEHMMFHLKGFDRERLEEGTIRIRVSDVSKSFKKPLIGSHTLDFEAVYFEPDHELYRVWVPLINDEDPDIPGIQGFLKFSVCILGPRDLKKEHNVAKDLAAERASLEAGIEPPIRDLLQQRRTLNFLVLDIISAEDLPSMDRNIMGAPTGLDAFVAVRFSENELLKTKVKKATVESKSQRCTAEWCRR